MGIIMNISTKDPETNATVNASVEVSECFKDSKAILDDIIRRFDNELRTKVSGRYKITLFSPYRTCDRLDYTFSKVDEDNLEIKSHIERDRLSFKD